MMELNFVLSIILPVLLAVSGAKAALDKGEKISWPIFFKTILLGLVTAGLISTTTSDLLLAAASTGIITWALDKLVNALINKTKRVAVQ